MVDRIGVELDVVVFRRQLQLPGGAVAHGGRPGQRAVVDERLLHAGDGGVSAVGRQRPVHAEQTGRRAAQRRRRRHRQ